MDLVYGALAGLVTGFVAGFAVAIVVLQGRRWRNAQLVKHGGVGYKDCVLTPLWIPGGAIGLVAGAIAGGATGSWRIAALAGLGLPAFLLVFTLGFLVMQSRDRT